MSLSTTIGTVAVIQRAAPYFDFRTCLSCWVSGVETVRAYLPPEINIDTVYGAGVHPTMSPDGKWLAYPRFLFDGMPAVVPDGCYVMDTATGELLLLPDLDGASNHSNKGCPSSPWWAADGRLVSSDGKYTWRPGQSVQRTLVDIPLNPNGAAVIPVPNCNGIIRIRQVTDSGIIELFDLNTGSLRASATVDVGGADGYSGTVTYVYQTGVQDVVVVERSKVVSGPTTLYDLCCVVSFSDGVLAELGTVRQANPPQSTPGPSSTSISEWSRHVFNHANSIVISHSSWALSSAELTGSEHYTRSSALYAGNLLTYNEVIYPGSVPIYLVDPVTGRETNVLSPLFARSSDPWVDKTGGPINQVRGIRVCSPSFVAYSPPGTFWQNMRYASEVSL